MIAGQQGRGRVEAARRGGGVGVDVGVGGGVSVGGGGMVGGRGVDVDMGRCGKGGAGLSVVDAEPSSLSPSLFLPRNRPLFTA